MSRLVEGIKEMLRKDSDDEDEPEYRYRTGYERSSRYRGYPDSASSGVRSEFQRPYGEDYRTSGYGKGYGRERSPRREYERERRSKREESDEEEEVVVLMVPMCCDKCQEKVEEELGEVEGVESVYCNRDRDRVVVRGSDIDTDRCLVKAERAVKKKCELLSNDDSEGEEVEKLNRRQAAYAIGGREDSGRYRSSRAMLGRLPSFASGRVMMYDRVGPRGQDYEEKDYNGFRRMPSFSRHRNHEAEYITSFTEGRPEVRDARRGRGYLADVRRMPSFNRHRYHDAEYINTGDIGYSPRTFVQPLAVAGTPYTEAYLERPRNTNYHEY